MALNQNCKKLVILSGFCSMTMFCFFALFLSVTRGENLTTLDGRTFTNAVFITNYPTFVIIRHDGGESGVKNTNLPAEFCAKHGIKIYKQKKQQGMFY